MDTVHEVQNRQNWENTFLNNLIDVLIIACLSTFWRRWRGFSPLCTRKIKKCHAVLRLYLFPHFIGLENCSQRKDFNYFVAWLMQHEPIRVNDELSFSFLTLKLVLYIRNPLWSQPGTISYRVSTSWPYKVVLIHSSWMTLFYSISEI